MSISSDIVVKLGRLAGIAGIGFGIVLVLFKGTLEKDFLPRQGLTSDQAYRIMFVVLLLAFGLAIVGVIAWITGARAKDGVVPTSSLIVLATVTIIFVGAAVIVGVWSSEAKSPVISADADGFVVTTPGNPTLAEMVDLIKKQKHVAITFGQTCKSAQRNARIQVNGAQLPGKNVPEFLENTIRPRTSISFNVITVQQDTSYEIHC